MARKLANKVEPSRINRVLLRKSPLYPPSWMDRFFDWVERLPIPFLLFYVLVFLGVVLFQHALLWLDGYLPVAEFAPIVFVQNIWSVFIVTAWHYVRNAGSLALIQFRPALDMRDAEFNTLKIWFKNLSARTGWIITAIAVPVFLSSLLFSREFYGTLFYSPTTIYLTILVVLFVIPMNVAFFVAVIRSLFAISRIYDRVKRINLFNLTSLYALSTFTSQVGMIFVVFVLINLATASLYGEGFALFYLILFGLMAIMVFILPLLGIHKRLVHAKARAVEVNNDPIEDGFTNMQNLVRAGKHDTVLKLRSSNLALLEYRAELNKISTWPWDTATLRTFITALLVPMTVWIVQQVLTRTIVK